MNIKVKEYIDTEINHLWCKVKIINKKNDLALIKADEKLMSRLEDMNEVRAQLKEQAETFISKEEYYGETKLINQKIEVLQKLVYIGLGIWLLLQILIVSIIILLK